MYLRQTTSNLADGTKVKYLQLCHNHWDKDAGYSKTKVIYSFGREDQLDKKVLQRLVDSINKYLHPDEAQFKTDKIVNQLTLFLNLLKGMVVPML